MSYTPAQRPKILKDKIEKMSLKNSAFQTLINRFGLEAENVRTWEIYTNKELNEIIEAVKIKNQKIMSSRRNKTNDKKTGNNKESFFPEGISVFEPHANAPDFIIASIAVNKDKFLDWIESDEGAKFLKNDKKYGDTLNLTLKESKGGNLYLDINTYGTDMEDADGKEAEEKEEKTGSRRARK